MVEDLDRHDAIHFVVFGQQQPAVWCAWLITGRPGGIDWGDPAGFSRSIMARSAVMAPWADSIKNRFEQLRLPHGFGRPSRRSTEPRASRQRRGEPVSEVSSTSGASCGSDSSLGDPLGQLVAVHAGHVIVDDAQVERFAECGGAADHVDLPSLRPRRFRRAFARPRAAGKGSRDSWRCRRRPARVSNRNSSGVSVTGYCRYCPWLLTSGNSEPERAAAVRNGLVTPISPPINSTSCFEIARPRPVPPNCPARSKRRPARRRGRADQGDPLGDADAGILDRDADQHLLY